ncbi:MAG: YbaY family lipoprotein [Caldilineaceae bacterium]|nr:YbaY family lipoprotein [Caldilineaceae bacterium]
MQRQSFLIMLLGFTLWLAACQPIQPVMPTSEAVVGTDVPPPTEAELTDILWQWQQSELSDGTVITVTDPTRYTLHFLADGNVQLQADCNRGQGSYAVTGESLTFMPIAVTLMACLPESQDSLFMQQISTVSTYQIDGDTLWLTLQEGGKMHFAAASASTDMAVLTGTVTYLQRIALPAGAVIEVQLQDVSKQDVAATVMASQTITTSGENVPIPFALTYDPAQIDERFTYALSARITVEGQLRWINTDHIAVLTQGAPMTDVEVLVRPAQ